jgi:hypothetical protein
MPPPKLSLFRTTYSLSAGPNRRVTASLPNEARSESAVAINPADPSNMICASKKFYDRAKYMSTIGISFTKDGGTTWTEVPLPPTPGHPEFTWLVDPDVAFAADGTAYLWGEPVDNPPTISTIAMVAYRSVDGGANWTSMAVLHNDSGDDKGWIAVDQTPGSLHYGTLYAVWGADTPLRFARSKDQAQTWKGVDGQAAGSNVDAPTWTYAPAMAIGPDGTIHVAWQSPTQSTSIIYTRSKDGGESFEPFRTIASNVKTFSSALPIHEGWPAFPGASFRLTTMATLAVSSDQRVIAAWPDMREGVGRIYFSSSDDNGDTWPAASQEVPMLPWFPKDTLHHFLPQLAVTGDGVFGCAFYQYDPTLNPPSIDVRIAPLWPGSSAFDFPLTITDHPWDPAINPPTVHNTTTVTFIGDYFGIAAGKNFFELVWTDTRTGLQELFAASVEVNVSPGYIPPEVVATIIAGVSQDGGGLVFIGGHVIRIPPWDPGVDLLQAFSAVVSARSIGSRAGRALEATAWRTIAAIATENAKAAASRTTAAGEAR